MSETIPTEIRLACGCDVPYEIGQPIFNYCDRKAGTTVGTIDGSRMCCQAFATRKGWTTRPTEEEN